MPVSLGRPLFSSFRLLPHAFPVPIGAQKGRDPDYPAAGLGQAPDWPLGVALVW